MPKRPAVQRDRDAQWQCLIVAHGDLASARRHVQVLCNALADSGHAVVDARVDPVGVKPRRVVRRPS